MEQLSFAIEWPEKNLPLPPMRSMRSGVLTGFSSVANDDLWNAKRQAAICQCNRLSYHRTKRTTETSQWRRRLRRYLHTILMDDKTNRILTDDSLMEKAALKKPNVSYLASEMGFEGVITSEDFLAALTENSKRL